MILAFFILFMYQTNFAKIESYVNKILLLQVCQINYYMGIKKFLLEKEENK